MPTALVTGANGHVGAHLVRALLEAGHEVVAFVRQTSDLTGLEGLDVTLRRGDVRDGESLTAAAAGCDVIFHTAAVYRMWARDPRQISEPALRGTENVFAAAKAAGIRRVVYTSSIAAVGSSASRGEARDETHTNDDPHNVYVQAKVDSERAARRLADELEIELVVVCPGAVLGSLDYRITPSTKFIVDWVNRANPTMDSTMNFVAASDVARVHLLAADRGRAGGRYLATGDNVYLPDIRPVLKEMTGAQPMHAPLPYFLMFVFVALVELIAWIRGREPSVSRSILKEGFGRHHVYDDRTTAQELGHRHRGFPDVLRETISWLLHLGALEPRVAARIAHRFEPDPAWLPAKKSDAPRALKAADRG